MTLCGAGVPGELARAQGAGREPGRAVSERRQRRAQHARALLRSAATTRRRPAIAVPAGNVLQIGRDAPASRSGCIRACPACDRSSIEGAWRSIQRTGYPNSEPLALPGHRHLVHGESRRTPPGTGWLGRYLDSLPSPVDPLVGVEHDARFAARRCSANRSACPRFPNRQQLRVRQSERRRRTRRSRGQRRRGIIVARAGRSAAAGVRVRQRAGGDGHARSRGPGRPAIGRRVTYPNTGLGQALRAVAGAMVARHRHAGCSGCTTGGFDTHAARASNQAQRAVFQPDGTLNDGLLAFYNDLRNQGLLGRHAAFCSSRSSAAASTRTAAQGTDHGAGQPDVGDGWGVRRRPLRHRRRSQSHPDNPDAREQRERHAVRNRLPLGLRTGHRSLAGRELADAVLGGNFARPDLDFI